MIWLVETLESGEWRPTAQNWPNRKMARAHAQAMRKKGFETRVEPYRAPDEVHRMVVDGYARGRDEILRRHR